MYDWLYEDRIADEDYFKPQEKYSYIDIICKADPGGAPEISQGELLSDGEVSEWASRENKTAATRAGPSISRLVVLFMPWPKGPLDDDKVPCSAATYKAIAAAWDLPRHVLGSLLRFPGTAKSLKRPYGAETPETIGATSSLYAFKFVVTHDVQKQTTFALVILIQNTLDDLTNQISQSAAAIPIPALIPLLVVEEEIFRALNSQEKFAQRIRQIARDTGLSPWYSAENLGHDRDLMKLTARLTRVAQEVAQNKERSANAVKAIVKVKEMHRHYLRILQQPQQQDGRGTNVANRATVPVCLTKEMDEISVRLDSVAELAQSLVLMTDRCQSDIQTNIQTVYSMVASRDNALNYRAAEASIRLAAITRRDSADMRVIAAVTLIFLPATFVATLFSTSFFDFSPRDPQAVVSHWVWIYWTVAAGLTALVLAGWLFTSRAMNERNVVALPETPKPAERDNESSISDSDSDDGSVAESDHGDGGEDEQATAGAEQTDTVLPLAKPADGKVNAGRKSTESDVTETKKPVRSQTLTSRESEKDDEPRDLKPDPARRRTMSGLPGQEGISNPGTMPGYSMLVPLQRLAERLRHRTQGGQPSAADVV